MKNKLNSTNILRALGFATMIGMLVIALNSDFRSSVRGALIPQYREVLAVAKADLDQSGNPEQILKVKTHNGIFLEVYGQAKNSLSSFRQELLATVKLPDQKDGYFTFNGEVTNLAVDVIDKDRQPKILTTSFDNDLVAHLNVYKFVRGQKELELVHLN
jgi:hypothetical protein